MEKKITKPQVYISKETWKDFESLDEYLQTCKRSHLTDDGKELPNPKPLVVYTGLNKPLSMKEEVERILSHSRFANEMRRQGQETFEEANDFIVGDDMVAEDYNSKYTVMFDEEPIPPNTQTSPSKEKEAPLSDPEPQTEPEANE